MFPKVWLVNLIMAGLIVFFGARAYKVWSQTDKSSVEIAEPQKGNKQEGSSIAKRGTLPQSDYETVARNNIFNPERVEPKPEKSEVPEVKQLAASVKTIALYGVIISGDYKTALVGKLEPKPGEKQSQWVKTGDAVAGFKVDEIRQESIIVSEGANQYEVLLYDKGRAKKATVLSKRESKPTVVSADLPAKSTGVSAGKAEDSKTGSEEGVDSETKYQHVKQPSEELRRKILEKYRNLPPQPPPQLNSPTGAGDWSIPMQTDRGTTSKSIDSKTGAVKPGQLNSPTGASEWSIPVQQGQATRSKSSGSSTGAMKPKTGGGWE
jgi:hypothetical protein